MNHVLLSLAVGIVLPATLILVRAMVCTITYNFPQITESSLFGENYSESFEDPAPCSSDADSIFEGSKTVVSSFMKLVGSIHSHPVF
jgi:hypothetical protein